jgi:hypothetical protein
LKAKILEAIRVNQPHHPNGMSARWLKEAVGLNDNDRSLSRPLKALVQEGLVSTNRWEKDKRVCLYLIPTQDDHTPPPMPKTLKCDQSLEPIQGEDLSSSHGVEKVDHTLDCVSNFFDGCDQSQNDSNPVVVKVVEDSSHFRHAQRGGVCVESPVVVKGGFANYRKDASPMGKRVGVESTAQTEHDGITYKTGDRVQWRGQQRQIERIELGDTTRLHLGLNQWADITEVEPIAVEFDDDSIADAAKLLKEAAETNDPAFVQDLLSWEMFTSLTPDSKQRIWGRLTEAERHKISELKCNPWEPLKMLTNQPSLFANLTAIDPGIVLSSTATDEQIKRFILTWQEQTSFALDLETYGKGENDPLDPLAGSYPHRSDRSEVWQCPSG